MRHRRLAATTTVALALSVAASVAAAPPALTTATTPPSADGVEPQWADADAATIYPGRQVRTAGSQCTSNFIFLEVDVTTDPETGSTTETLEDVLIGMAAHCAGTDGNTATNGCVAGTRELGTPVEIDGASRSGTLTYSSWVAMQNGGPQPEGACQGNDFALVSIHPDDWAKVNPSLPFWGGPVGVGDATSTGESNYSFGNSGLRLGIEALGPKQGVTAAMLNAGWTHVVYAVSPGVPGDSGSGTLDSDGRAIGVTSVIYAAPFPAGNGLTDVSKALDYASTYTGRSYRLVHGTEPFEPLLP